MYKFNFFDKLTVNQTGDNFSCFPPEVLENIFPFLKDKDIVNFSRINKRIFLLMNERFCRLLLKICLTSCLASLEKKHPKCASSIQNLCAEINNISFEDSENVITLLKKLSKLKIDNLNITTIGQTCEWLKIKVLNSLPIEQTLEISYKLG